MGLTYIHTCRSYVHTSCDIFKRHIFTVTFTSAHLYSNVYMRVAVARMLADLSDCGLRREQSSQKCVMPCLEQRWTAVQNVTPLALSLAEKFVTVHTNTYKRHKQTINNISTPCISACMDNEQSCTPKKLICAWATLIILIQIIW